MEIQKILDELKEKKKQAEEIEAHPEVQEEALGRGPGRAGGAGRTRTSSRAAGPGWPPTRTCWSSTRRRTSSGRTPTSCSPATAGSSASAGSSRSRVPASARGTRSSPSSPASTLDNVVFFADDGTAYTMRVNEVPASSGYGEPITKFFKLADQVKVIAAVGDRPALHPRRPAGEEGRPRRPVPAGRHLRRQRPAAAVRRVPAGIHQGRPTLRQARRRRPGRDGRGWSATRTG